MSANMNFEPTSTRPYLIRALHEWCTDNGLTPYVTVAVDRTVQVPLEYVKDGEIVLNIGYDATTALRLGNDYLEFKARFSGAVRDIMIPVEQVVAIFARENGQGMAFPKPESAGLNRHAAKATQRPVMSLASSSDSAGPEGALRDEAHAGNVQGTSDAAGKSPKSVKTSKANKSGKPALTRIK